MEVKNTVKTTPLGGKVWISAILFGLIGQIAWAVENMYFATFAQDILLAQGYKNAIYTATTLMVVFSALTATVTTIFAGALCDKTGKRKPFIAFGYIAWGLTIMGFALIPVNFGSSAVAGVIALLVVLDCIMTVAGSTANDAAFNTWVTDVADTTNRGKLDTTLSIFGVFAMVVIFVLIAPFTYDKGDYRMFFLVVGAIPIVAGVAAFFLLKDAPDIIKNKNPNFLRETFYGFRPEVIKDNKMLYICLLGSSIIGISQQTYMSYLINFIQVTLGVNDYFIPLAVIILLSAVLVGLLGFFFDKIGREKFYFPVIASLILGTLLIYLIKIFGKASTMPLLYIAGTITITSALAGGALFSASFRDYIPAGAEGRFQGVRMSFNVLIPMVIGPLITLAIGRGSLQVETYPYEMFLYAAIVAVFAFIPTYFVKKDAKRLRTDLIAKRDAAL